MRKENVEMNNWNTDEIMSLVKTILGQDAKEVLLDEEELHDDVSESIITNIDTESSINEDPDEYYISRGITKIVIIPKNTDYVIKIPFTGIYHYTDSDELYLVAKVDFDEYDVFDIEKQTYNNLFQESKVAFLPNYFIGTFNGIPIYIQEKIKVTCSHHFYDATYSYGEKKESVAKIRKESLYDDDHVDTTCLREFFIADLITWYGEEATKWILADCKDIDDLHGNNYGYTEDGRPVIFDYAGFDDCMYQYIN